VRELDFDGENITHDGRVIDVVYRRAVTGEMVQKQDQIPKFLDAIKSGKVCVIGHPRTQIIHVKKVFQVLRDTMTKKLLNREEWRFVNAHVPFTTSFSESNYDYNKVLIDKGKWVVKPSDEYASRNVTIGEATDTREWRKSVENGIKDGFLLQEHVSPPKMPNCYFNGDKELVADDFGAIIGLYIFNGEFGGIFTRAGRNAIISSQHGGFSMGTMVVK
jgi:hypothetical protein